MHEQKRNESSITTKHHSLKGVSQRRTSEIGDMISPASNCCPHEAFSHNFKQPPPEEHCRWVKKLFPEPLPCPRLSYLEGSRPRLELPLGVRKE